MGRLLLFAMLGVIGYLLVRRLLQSGAPTLKHPVPPPDQTIETVRCTTCGVHVPRREALYAGGQYYCDQHQPPGSAAEG